MSSFTIRVPSLQIRINEQRVSANTTLSVFQTIEGRPKPR